jgi:hypothetical protein
MWWAFAEQAVQFVEGRNILEVLRVEVHERLIEINHPVMAGAGLEIFDLLAHAAVVGEEGVLGRKFLFSVAADVRRLSLISAFQSRRCFEPE